MESKNDKFVRLAEARANRAIDSIRSLAKLANRNHYEFSPEEVQKIFAALRHEIDEAKAAYTAALASEYKHRFKLKLNKG